MVSRLDRSVSVTPGVATSAMSTAGTRKAWVIRSAATKRRSSTGSMSRRITEVPPRDMPLKAQPDPPMWNSGIATRLTVRSSISNASPAARSSMTATLRLASITPLGSPVVPEV